MKQVIFLFSLIALFIFASLQTFCQTIQNDFHTRQEALLTTYNKVGDFYENGCVIVSNDSKSDIVKYDGTFLTNFIYEDIKPFYHHFAAVKKAGKWGFIDITGKEILPCIYENNNANDKEEINSFYKGKVWLKQGGKYGKLDSTGKILVPFLYNEIEVMKEKEGIYDYTKVKLGNYCGLLDYQDKLILPIIFDKIQLHKNGKDKIVLISTYQKDTLHIYNQNFQLIYTTYQIDALYTLYVHSISFPAIPHLFFMIQNVKKGFTFYDKRGKFLLETDDNVILKEFALYKVGKSEFQPINTFILGKTMDKYAILDTNLKVLTQAIYKEVNQIGNCLLVSKIDEKGKEKFGLLDKNAKELFACKYEKISYLINKSDTKIGIRDKNSFAILDKNGNYLIHWQQKYNFISENKFHNWIVSEEDTTNLIENTNVVTQQSNNGIVNIICKKPTYITKYGVLDSALQILIPIIYDDIIVAPQGNGYFAVKKEDRLNVLDFYDFKGKKIDTKSSEDYNWFNYFFNEKKAPHYCYYYDSSLQKISLPYKEIRNIDKNLFICKADSLHYGVLSAKFKQIQAPIYCKIKKAYNYLIATTNDKSIDILNSENGHLLYHFKDSIEMKKVIWTINSEYKFMKWEKKQGKYGLITKEGEEIIPFIYDKIEKKGIFNNEVWAIIYPNAYHQDTFIQAFQHDEDKPYTNSELYYSNGEKRELDIHYSIGNNIFLCIDKNKFGTINRNGDIIVPFAYQYQGRENNYYILKQLPLQFLINKENKNLFPKGVQNIKVLNSQLIAYQENDKWGLIQADGTMLHSPQFDEIKQVNKVQDNLDFITENTYFSVFLGNKIGYLDSTGKNWLLPPIYEGLYSERYSYKEEEKEIKVENCIYFAKQGDKIAIISKNNNKLLTDFKYKAEEYHIYSEANKVILHRTDGYYVWLDPSTLKERVLFKGDSIKWENNFAQTPTHLLIFDKKGKLIFKEKGRRSSFETDDWGFGEEGNRNYFIFTTPNDDAYILYNNYGKKITKEAYQSLRFLDNTYLSIQKAGKYGLIDTTGKEIFSPSYDKIENWNVTKEIFLITKEEKVGLVSANKKVNIPCIYAEFSEDIIDNQLVARGEKYCGLINLENDTLLPFQYKGLQIVGKNVYAYQQDCHFGLIDEKGNIILPDTFESVSNLIDNRYLIASILTKNENKEEDNDNSEYTMGIVDIITKQIILPFEYKQRDMDTYYEVFDIPTSLEKKFEIFQFTKKIPRTQEDVRFLIYHKEKNQWLLPEQPFFNEVEYFPKKGEFVVNLIEKKEKLVIDTFGNVVKKILPSAYPNASPEYVNGRLFYILRENKLNALADSNYQLIFPYTATTIRSMKHHAQQKKETYFLVGNQIYEVTSKMTYTLPFEPEAGYYPEAGKLWLMHNGKPGYYNLLENQWIAEPTDYYPLDWFADKKIAKVKQKDKIYFINERGECVGEEPKVYDKLW